MAVRIAVVGRSPTWRRGMTVVLMDAGYESVELDDLSQWRPGHGGHAVVAGTIDDGLLSSVQLFSEEHPHIAVIAVVGSLTVANYAQAVRSGAIAVLDEIDSPATITSVVVAALEGRTMAPHFVVNAMARLVPDEVDLDSWLSGDERSWLIAMAGGLTVADLADTAGYSERAMFRRLKEVYLRLGVANRTEALLWASRHGLLVGDEGAITP